MIKQNNPVTAVLAALVDQVAQKAGHDPEPPIVVDPAERMEGRSCLVTGANSGLGLATAVELARRGAHVVMACRSGIPAAGEEVKRRSGSDRVEMLHVDLADLASVLRLVETLKQRGATVDVLVQNAGVVPRQASRTRDGFEHMFQVNYLAPVLLIWRLLETGVIPNHTFVGGEARAGGAAERRPRIVIVSSESHRSARPLEIATFGAYVDYGLAGSMAQYAHTKLALCTFAVELARRLREDTTIDVAVHALCPGPVDSNMARHAPAWAKPLLGPVMRTFFSSPQVAALPVVYLAGAAAIEGQSGIYLHRTHRKAPAEQARDPEFGQRLWEKTEALLGR